MMRWMALVGLVACGDSSELPCRDGFARNASGLCDPIDSGEGDSGSVDTEAADPDAALLPLDAPQLLRRLSLDLRGVLPSIEELDAVEADPGALDGLRDAYLEDPRLADRLLSLFAEQWHTQVDEYLVFYKEYQELAVDSNNEYPFERSVGNEPLQLMVHVATENLPWSEIVTADYTMSNPLLSSIWSIDYPEGAEGWQKSTYTDGRPAAGILSTNGLWWRYYTTYSNFNRGRVAALTRLLICEDYLARPVVLENAVGGDDEDIESALRSSPYCMGCHNTLDPIAASLFGFWVANEFNIFEIDTYHPEREPLGEMLLDVTPQWYGQPVNNLQELGLAIADDPRFPRCTAQRMAQALWRREVGLEDFQRVELLRQDFLAGEMRLLSLLRAVTDTPVYRAGALSEEASESQLEIEATTRMMTSPMLASVVEDLTGFAWTWQGFEQMDNDTYGYRIQAGGVDGAYVAAPQATPSMNWVLAWSRLAEAGASKVVERELQQSQEAELLSLVELETTSDDPEFAAQLLALHWRFYAQRASEEWLEQVRALWEAMDDEMGAQEAWVGLLLALLCDPEFTSY